MTKPATVTKREAPTRTHYSRVIPGAVENHRWAARADVTRGTVGISQQDEHGQWTDRVLLARAQWEEIVAFVAGARRKR